MSYVFIGGPGGTLAYEGCALANNLTENIRECYRHAEDCRRKAKEQSISSKTSWTVNDVGCCWREATNWPSVWKPLQKGRMASGLKLLRDKG
jgi:hypothetical protein